MMAPETLKSGGQWMMAGLFGLAVASLIAVDVFDLSGTDFKSFFKSGAHGAVTRRGDAKSRPGELEEIRQYTEFVTVSHKTLALQITTGIRYDNSKDQNIEAQWCYAQRGKGANTGFAIQLTIQELKGGKMRS